MPRYQQKVKCPHCPVYVVPDLLARHVARHAGTSSAAPAVDVSFWFAAPSAASVERDRQARVRCERCGMVMDLAHLDSHLDDHAERDGRAARARERLELGDVRRRSRFRELSEGGYSPERVRALVDRCAREVAEAWDEREGVLDVTDADAAASVRELKRHMQRANDAGYNIGDFVSAVEILDREYRRRCSDSGWRWANLPWAAALDWVKGEVQDALLLIGHLAGRGQRAFD